MPTRVLLDTHVFLWFITADPRLDAEAVEILDEPSVDVLLSVASLWEIAIKHSIGKLKLLDGYEALVTGQVEENGIHLLPIEPRHLLRLTDLPLHHRDPFDRLLVAQAVEEDLPIIGADEAFDAYPVHRIW